MDKKTIWISFDLGVRGDYEGMFEFLDSHGAKECVDGLAVVKYTYSGELLDCLEVELKGVVEDNKRTRVYVVYRDDEDERKMKGRFLFGGRRAPPWSGYGLTESQDDTDEY